MDECYFGPKAKGRGPGMHKEKVAVVEMVERESGQRRSVVMKRVTGGNILKVIDEHIEDGTMINTDQSGVYARVPTWYGHRRVRHKVKGFKTGKAEYHRVDKDGQTVTTNYAESSFSLLRRGVIGTFHSLSSKYLPLYVAEFDMRFNLRKMTDGERMVAMIAKTAGKRTTLKKLKA